MYGLMIAAIIGAWKHFGKEMPNEQVFLLVTNFLFWWYVVFSVVSGLIALMAMIGIPIYGLSKGNDAAGIFGAIAGFVGGGSLSVLVGFLFALHSSMYIGGAYLLKTSLHSDGSTYAWNKDRLIWGSLILFLAALKSLKASSSSKSSSDKD